jgi:hypothetical protein
VLLATSLGTSGCSWVFMQKAPEAVLVPDYPVECSSSRAAPVLDSICVGYFVVNTIALAAVASCDSAAYGEACYEAAPKAAAMVVSAGLAGLCALSAGSGYRAAGRCRAVKQLNAACITGHEGACHALSPRWTPARGRGAPAWAEPPPGGAAPGWGEPPADGEAPAPAAPPDAPPPPSGWEAPRR